jgi:hypothetical protein
MKKLLLALSIISVSFSTFAGWYIKPSLGIGRTGLTSILGTGPEESIFLKGEIAAGNEIGKIRIETGLGYVNPGYEFKGLVFESGIDPTTGQIKYYTDIDYRFSYIYVPIRAAYQINIGGGLSIVPALGIAPSYNVHTGRKFGAFADAILLAEYKIGAISITAGASYKHMLSTVSDGGNERFSLLSGDAGILYHF